MKNTGQFQKGNIPHCPIKAGQRISPETEFKRGHIPANKLCVGAITVRQERNGHRRAWVKIAEPSTWLLRAVYVWQSARGKIPYNFVLHHIDKDAMNDKLNNLCVLTRAAHKNIHKQELQKGKVTGYKARTYTDNRIPTKMIICSSCSYPYTAKYQRKDALCDTCLRERRRQRARNNQHRLRIANKKQKACSAQNRRDYS
jgi:hypothetical protein